MACGCKGRLIRRKVGENVIRKTRVAAIAMVIFYLFTVLYFTVFNRTVHISAAQLDLFWSYKAWLIGDTDLGREILANMLMFVPFGFLLSAILPKRRFIIPAAIIFSLTIETLQLFLMRGLFEWDDVISNTIGACVGILLFLLISRIPGEKHKRIAITAISSVFMIVCAFVFIRGHGTVEADSTSRAYCFQVDSLEFTDGTIELEGFALRYEHPDLDYTLLLRSSDGTRIKLEKEIIVRPDVNEYFSCDYDYTISGFTARGTIEAGEYEILIKWPWSIALSTGVYISPSGTHYMKDDEFTAPGINSEFIEDGILRVYRPDFHCWVYQFEGCLYWVVDQDFYFEDDNTTYIQYQLWTTKEDLLPQKRIENGWMWDNIGGYFEDYEVEGDWNGYRVMKRELPTAYPITSIVTGYYKTGEWIWKEYFRPYYEF